jgi:predicted pyridoxine 5'-phosphate oxidase superfamily flavin-nucleotide-binding protein
LSRVHCPVAVLDDRHRWCGRPRRDPELLRRSAVDGRTPLLAIGVEVEQCFMHCAKAFRRSALWAHGQWPGPDALPSLACVLFDKIQPEGVTLQEYDRDIEEGYVKRLY